jgi:hypothetical protein
MKKSKTLQGLVITIFFLLAGVFTAKGQANKTYPEEVLKKIEQVERNLADGYK